MSSNQNESYLLYTGDYITPLYRGLFQKPLYGSLCIQPYKYFWVMNVMTQHFSPKDDVDFHSWMVTFARAQIPSNIAM